MSHTSHEAGNSIGVTYSSARRRVVPQVMMIDLACLKTQRPHCRAASSTVSYMSATALFWRMRTTTRRFSASLSTDLSFADNLFTLADGAAIHQRLPISHAQELGTGISLLIDANQRVDTASLLSFLPVSERNIPFVSCVRPSKLGSPRRRKSI